MIVFSDNRFEFSFVCVYAVRDRKVAGSNPRLGRRDVTFAPLSKTFYPQLLYVLSDLALG